MEYSGLLGFNGIFNGIFHGNIMGIPSGYLTVRHGINGPNRNRWFTELNSMVDLSMAMLNNQMVHCAMWR